MGFSEKLKKFFLGENLLTICTVSGVLAGVALGFILREAKEDSYTDRQVMYVRFIGDLFLRMLKSLILPLIVSSLISAIGNLDLSLSRKIGFRAIAYYMLTTVSSNTCISLLKRMNYDICSIHSTLAFVMILHSSFLSAGFGCRAGNSFSDHD